MAHTTEPAEPATVLVKIENSYSDGHESTSEHRLAAPNAQPGEEALDEWWDEKVFNLTGDGHGAKNPGLNSLHTAVIIEGPAALLEESYDWG